MAFKKFLWDTFAPSSPPWPHHHTPQKNIYISKYYSTTTMLTPWFGASPSPQFPLQLYIHPNGTVIVAIPRELTTCTNPTNINFYVFFILNYKFLENRNRP